MKIALISPNAKSLNELGEMLGHASPAHELARHEGGLSKLRNVAELEHPDVIIVEGLYHDPSDLSPVEFVTTHYPQMIVILLCPQHTSEFLIHAMRAGVREVLPSPVTRTALEAALARAESKLGLRSAQRSGRILAFVSCKGGSGATFLAANVGHGLGAEGKRTLLIDLNLQLGEAVLTVHDHKATSDIAEVARNLSRLDASFLAASVLKVAPNFDILAAPEDPAQSMQVKPEHLEAILNLAVTQYDFVLLDVRNTLDELTVKALDRAQTVFLVVQAMLPYVRNASRLMAVFRSLGYAGDKVEVVVNRYWKSGEIGLEDLRAALGTSRLRVVPNGYREVAKAVNQGVPLAGIAKSSAVHKALGEIVQSLLPKADQAQGGLLERLLKHR